MTICIRPARAEDLDALITLLRRAWLATWAPELPFTAVQEFVTHDPARTFAQTKWREFMVADIDGALAGMFQIENNWIRIIQLAPELRRRGIGSTLMDEAERLIREKYPEARLEVRAFNNGALAFYRSRGWTEVRRYDGTECGAPVETIEMVKVFT